MASTDPLYRSLYTPSLELQDIYLLVSVGCIHFKYKIPLSPHHLAPPILISLITGTFAVVSLMVSNAVTHVLESDSIFEPCANLQIKDYNKHFYYNNETGENVTCEEFIVKIAVTVTFATGLVMVREMYV